MNLKLKLQLIIKQILTQLSIVSQSKAYTSYFFQTFLSHVTDSFNAIKLNFVFSLSQTLVTGLDNISPTILK